MKFAIFQQKIDEILPEKKEEILPEFHRNGQEMTKCLEILRKTSKVPENFGKCQKFPEFVRNFIFHFIFSIHSLVTPCAAEVA